MFEWLRGRSPIDTAIEAQNYKKAMQLISEALENEERVDKVRALRQTLAEVQGLDGQHEAAILTLRELMNEYSRDGMDTKAIALHKMIADIRKDSSDVELDAIADAVAAAPPKPIDIAPLDDSKGVVTEKVTTRVAKTPLFSDLEKPEVRALIEGLTLHKKEPGDVLMVEGEPGDSLFILTDGAVRVHVKNAAQHSVAIRDMEGSSFFGEISIVYGKPRTATIACRSYCEILELDKPTLDGITKKHPKVAAVLKAFCDQRAESREELEGRRSK